MTPGNGTRPDAASAETARETETGNDRIAAALAVVRHVEQQTDIA